MREPPKKPSQYLTHYSLYFTNMPFRQTDRKRSLYLFIEVIFCTLNYQNSFPILQVIPYTNILYTHRPLR